MPFTVCEYAGGKKKRKVSREVEVNAKIIFHDNGISFIYIVILCVIFIN